ncbi:hypothetical protein AB8Q97_27475, partial [Klebsiella pneumoniae subsp. ozaenae]
FAGKKSAQIREILISESAWEEMTCLFAPSLELVRKTMQLKPMFSENARSRFARLVHEKFEDLDFLEEVNEELGDPFSYHTLLAPLAIRLEKLTSLYKGINW